MKDLSRYINKVPVKVELDTSMEKILAIQLLYKQVIDVMDTIEGGSVINVKSDWDAEAGSESEILNKPALKTVATSGSYNDLSNKPIIPTTLADLTDDATHRLVTDTEKSTWNGKQNPATTLAGYGITDTYTKTDSRLLSSILSVATALGSGTNTSVTNPEWKIVITDRDDRILLGVRQDDTWYQGTDLATILNCVVDSYAQPSIKNIVALTQAEYDLITPDSNTLYHIIES